MRKLLTILSAGLALAVIAVFSAAAARTAPAQLAVADSEVNYAEPLAEKADPAAAKRYDDGVFIRRGAHVEKPWYRRPNGSETPQQRPFMQRTRFRRCLRSFWYWLSGGCRHGLI
jgi:hypothetical protein